MWDGNEAGDENAYHEMQFSDVSIRQKFVRKVFGILTGQLVITIAIVAPFVLVDSVKLALAAQPGFVFIPLAGSLICICAIACCEGARRKHPLNLILLGAFTICEGVLIGAVCASVRAEDVGFALVTTAVVAFALTMFALQTKWDFTGAAPYMMVVLLAFMMFGLFAMFFQSRVLQLVYASIGAVIFGCYLVLDVQLMLGGKHKFSISPDEYVFAALALYLDIINLFLYILRIISASRN